MTADNMTGEGTIGKLRWPGRDLPAVSTPDGWSLAEERAAVTGTKMPASPDGPLPSDRAATAILGERLPALEMLGDSQPGTVELAYADLPRPDVFRVVDERLRFSIWLSLVRSHLEAALPLLAPGGRLVVQIDDAGAACARSIMDGICGGGAFDTTLLWEKKYGPQNDLRGRVDDAHDYIYVFSPVGRDEEGTGSLPETTWWSSGVAGKTEDGTREIDRLRRRGILEVQNIPRTSKPAKLVKKLLESFTGEGDTVLELFSDTAFASAAAIETGRRPILLAGGTREELSLFEGCGGPWLRHLLKESEGSPPGIVEVENHLKPRRSRSFPGGGPLGYDLPGETVPETVPLRPLEFEGTSDGEPHPGHPSLIIEADPGDVLLHMVPVLRGESRLSYLQVPEPPPIDDTGEWGNWLSSLAGLVSGLPRLLAFDGTIALEVGERGYAATRLVAEEILGVGAFLGTIAIESEEDEDGSDHRYVLPFRPNPESSPGKLGLPATRSFAAADGDPRGPWRDPGHKGARSGGPNLADRRRIPPYRWRHVSGDLPPGAWRINPVTGVIWSPSLEASGNFRFDVEVIDDVDQSSVHSCEIRVLEEGEPHLEDRVWWLDEEPIADAGDPRIVDRRLPDGLVGRPYWAMLRAEGGRPLDAHHEPPGEALDESGNRRTRYWDFARDTYARDLLRDRIVFSSNLESRPRQKRYEEAETGDHGIIVELGWWDRERLSGSEPLRRLIRLFTAEGDLVLEIPRPDEESYRPLATTMDRRAVAILSPGSGYMPERAMDASGRCLPRARPGAEVGRWHPDRGTLELSYEVEDFPTKLAFLEGFLPGFLPGSRPPIPTDTGHDVAGISPDGLDACVVLEPSEWPTYGRCMALSETLSYLFARVHVYYFRGRPPRGIEGLRFRRVPFELSAER